MSSKGSRGRYPTGIIKDLPIYTEDEDKPLTDLQRMFVYYHATQGMPVVAAARLAGYQDPGTAGSDTVRCANVKKALRIAREQNEKAVMMTKKKVMDGFLESIEMAKAKSDPFVMIAGWREIAKLCGYYEPIKHKIEIDAKGQIIIQRLQTLTDAQLISLAQGETGDIIDGEIINDNSEQEDPTPPGTGKT